MRRFLVLFWLILSAALASGQASAMAAPECPMSASSSSTMHHDGKDCCKPACAPNCATPCPGAVVPATVRAPSPAEPVVKRHNLTVAAPLHSIVKAGADPPPRTTFS